MKHEVNTVESWACYGPCRLNTSGSGIGTVEIYHKFIRICTSMLREDFFLLLLNYYLKMGDFAGRIAISKFHMKL